ncbi:mannose-6-phosphate isomerase, type 1 [Actinokineospora alba]|uniref:mannose-6-phosphate isomerase n=1 Tax=Actinokineospora alba TaxID=504798 RepID=A0A1H0UAJ6_9PSEU|nr:mannose-6-phosphate isomerase, class I [Actinokineospora alba]TDP65222.1 mannose-6-phosphate isomerase type 1 [Actinokineospora alba]SDH57094.1 mannose-6-phosphate isomerase [Actinokineospora alba]SDP63322.1 mannose-6-phosphate isomerase, type 1 [Actinokineospora alba]
MELLRNAVRPYAWGSRTIIAELLGKPVPAPHPEAELWMGAHPGDPSHLARTDVSLIDCIEADPERQLGAENAARWGNKLPFLLKILAVEEPLSLQAHPSAVQAADGYAREEALGIARDAGERNYPDPTAKPELVCALTEFHALAGFRDPHRTVALLDAVRTPSLSPYIDLLSDQPDPDGLRALFTTWITLPQTSLESLLPDLFDACVRHMKEHGEFTLECQTVLELGERYPGDSGVLAALLLNRLVLRPGEAIYLPAGNLHAYLHGTGVEILANSDNILRGGLTPKHVDVPELLRVLDFRCGDMPVTTGDHDGELRTYRTDAAEFELSRIEWPDDDRAEVAMPSGRPQIVVCTEGAVTVRGYSGEITLARGHSIWVPAADPELKVRPDGTGRAQIFIATVGAESPAHDTL